MSRYNSNRNLDLRGKEKFVRVNCRYNRHNPRPDTRLYKFEEIPEFWGSNFPNPIEEWVSLLDQYFDYYGFPDYKKVERCRTKLTGLAALFVDLREMKKPISCWSELKNMLLEEYSLTKNPFLFPPSNKSPIDSPDNSKETNRVESPLNQVVESPLPIVLSSSPSNEIVDNTHNLFCEVHGKMKINIDIDKVAVEIHFMLQDFNVGNEVWVRMLLCSRPLLNADLDNSPVRETAPQQPLLITLLSWEKLKAKFESMRISLLFMPPLQKFVPTRHGSILGHQVSSMEQDPTGQKSESPFLPHVPSWKTMKKLIAMIIQDVCVTEDREKYVVPPPPPWPPRNDKHAVSENFFMCKFLHNNQARFYKYMVYWRGKFKEHGVIVNSSEYQFVFPLRDMLYKYMTHWKSKFKADGSLRDNRSIRNPTARQSLQFTQFDPGG